VVVLVVLLMALSAAFAASAPVKLAVFEFELEDYSAGAASTGETPADAKVLAGVTSDVRNLLAQSGRYRLVDVAEADAAAATARRLHECDGCDAPIALKLGAEQSLVGVVKRTIPGAAARPSSSRTGCWRAGLNNSRRHRG
jgi:hypothetical protein